MNSEAMSLSQNIFLTMCLLVLSMHVMYTDAWLGATGAAAPVGRDRTSSPPPSVLPMPFRAFHNDDLRRYQPSSVRLSEGSSDATSTEEIPTGSCTVKISDLNDMDVVVYSLLDDSEEKLCLGALQEDGVLSPLSAWTDEPAFGDSLEFLVDEVDRFVLQEQTNDQREADGIDANGNGKEGNTIRIHHLLSEEEVSYGQRQCARGVHNPHGEESELLYYVDQQIIDRFEIGMELKPELETLW